MTLEVVQGWQSMLIHQAQADKRITELRMVHPEIGTSDRVRAAKPCDLPFFSLTTPCQDTPLRG